MFRIQKSIDADFAHQVKGHPGLCSHLHGHTWKFEVTVGAELLQPPPHPAFVLDFKELKTSVLQPVHDLLDHSLVLDDVIYETVGESLHDMGGGLLKASADPEEAIAAANRCPVAVGTDAGGTGRLRHCNGLKVVTFDFNPTSERLARWFYHHAARTVETLVRGDGASPTELDLNPRRVRVEKARVYESLYPVEAFAEYSE